MHLEHDRYKLGRSSVSDLAFPGDQKLSREHLVFERIGEGWTVRDSGSRNGSQLNGARLTGTVRLAHGDQITAGHLSIRYDMRGELTDTKPGEIIFVEQDLATTTPSVSVDLKSALEASWEPRFQRLDAVLDVEPGECSSESACASRTRAGGKWRAGQTL
jgi:predicted component of type VI protein secretion system